MYSAQTFTDKIKEIFASFRDLENGAYQFKDDEKILKIILDQDKEVEKNKAISMLILVGYKILNGETDYSRILANIDGYVDRLERELNEEGATEKKIEEENERRKHEFKRIKKEKEKQNMAVKQSIAEGKGFQQKSNYFGKENHEDLNFKNEKVNLDHQDKGFHSEKAFSHEIAGGALNINNNYQYETEDIQAILMARLKELAYTAKPIDLLSAILNADSEELKQRFYPLSAIVKIREQLKQYLLADKKAHQDKPQARIILIPANLGFAHWVGILLELDPQGNVIRAEYFDSLSGAKIPPHWQQHLKEIYNCELQPRSLLMQHDHTSCGAYTIENLLLGVQNLPAPKDLTNLVIRKKHLICLKQHNPRFYQDFFERQRDNQSNVADPATQIALHEGKDSFSSQQIQRILQIKKWIQQINNKEIQQHLLGTFNFQAEAPEQDQSHSIHLCKIRQGLKQAAATLQDPEDKKLLITIVKQLFRVSGTVDQREIGEILDCSDFRLQYAEIAAIGLERELSFDGERSRLSRDNVAAKLQAKQNDKKNITDKIDKPNGTQKAEVSDKTVLLSPRLDKYAEISLQPDKLSVQEKESYHHDRNTINDILSQKEQEKFQQQQTEKTEQDKKRVEALKLHAKEEHEIIYSNQSKNKLWGLDPEVYLSNKLSVLYIQELTSEPDIETIQKEYHDKMPLLIKYNSQFYICDYYTGDKICMMLASQTQAELYDNLSFSPEVRQLSNSSIEEYLQPELSMIDCPKDEDKAKFVEQLIKRMKEALHQGLPIIDCPKDGADFKFVQQLIKRRPIPYYKVSKVKIINNFKFAQEFELCTERHAERKVKQRPGVQQIALNRLKNFTYTDKKYEGAQMFVGFRAMDEEKFLRVMRSGLAKEAAKDKQSFYGKGIYLASDIELSKRNYGGGYNGKKPLIVCWASFFNPYVIENLEEAKRRSGRANKDDHDAHYIPTKPKNFNLHNKLQEKSYIPAANDLENAVTDELVVFEESQCLPRYLIEIEREIPELNSAEKLIDFASTIAANETVAYTFAGTKIENQSRKDLYIRALEKNKNSLNPLALTALSEVVGPGEVIEICGSKTNIKELLQQCLKENEENASIFNAMGRQILTNDEVKTLKIAGYTTRTDFFIKAIELNLQSSECLKAEYYLNLAKTMQAGKEVTILGCKRNKQELLQTCLQLNPHMSEAYVELGHLLLGEQTTTLLSETGEFLKISKKELYRKAIYYNKDYAAAYRYLASVLDEEKINVDHMTDEKINAKQLLIKACEKDPQDAENFAALSLCLTDNEPCEVKIDDKKMNKNKKEWALHAHQLSLKNANQLNPKNANVWFALAECLPTRNDVIIELEVEGRSQKRNRLECLQQAIKCDPEHAPSLVALAELEKLAGKKKKEKDNLCRAISADKNYKKAYRELVKLDGAGEQSFLLNDERLSVQDVLVQAIKYHPSEEDLWFELGKFLYSSSKDKITVTINEQEYDYEKCYEKSLELAQKIEKKDKECKFSEYIKGRPDLNTLLKKLTNISREEIKADEQLKQGLDLYVDVNAAIFFKDKYQQEDLSSTDSVVKEFMQNSEQQVLLLEGHAGTSKTLYCRHLEKWLWQKLWQENSLDQITIPLFVPLGLFGGDLAKPKQQKLIERVLSDKGFTLEQIELLKRNKFIFILDGFDEVSVRFRGDSRCRIYDAIYYHHWQGKTIVTSRPGAVKNSVLYKCKVEKRFITFFLATQIEDYLVKHVSSEYNYLDWSITRYKEELTKFPEIKEMIKEPLLLKLILQILPNLDDLIQQGKMQRPLTRLIIYRECIQMWISAEIAKRKVVDDSDYSGSDSESSLNIAQQIRKYLMELAVKMLDQGETSIEINCNEEQGKNFKLDRASIDNQGFKSGLIKKSGNIYYFIHNSFKEYFASQKMLEEFGKDKLEEHSAWVNRVILRDEYSILRFMADALQMELGAEYKKKLFDIIHETKTQNERMWKIAASNALSILNAACIVFSGMDFEEIKVPCVNLENALCYGTNFRKADLSNANLKHANLIKANLVSAKIKDIFLDEYPEFKRDNLSAICCICCFENKNLLVSGNDKGDITLWDIKSNYSHSVNISQYSKYKRNFKIEKLISNEKNNKLVSLSLYNNTRANLAIIHVWQLQENKLSLVEEFYEEYKTGDHEAITLNIEKNQLLIADGKKISIWSLTTNNKDTETFDYCHLEKDITSLCLSEREKYLIIGDNVGTICLVFLGSHFYEVSEKWVGHKNAVINILSFGEKIISCAENDNVIKIWEFSKGKLIHELKHQGDEIKAICMTDRVVVSASKEQSAYIWDPNTGRCQQTLSGEKINCLVVIENKKLFFGNDNGTIKSWNIPDGEEKLRRDVTTHDFEIIGICCYENRIITCSKNQLTVWNLNKKIIINKKDFSSDTINAMQVFQGALILAIGKEILIWDLEAQQELRNLHGHSKDIINIAISLNGKLSSVSEDKTIRIWDLSDGTQKYFLKQRANCLAWSLCNTQLIAGCEDKAIRIWEGDKVTTVLSGHLDKINALKALETSIVSASDDGTIRIWDILTGKQEKLLLGHIGAVKTFIIDREVLISGGSVGSIYIWNILSEEKQELIGHTGIINGLCLSNKQLFSVCSDKSVRIWEQSERTWRQIAELTNNTFMTQCNFANMLDCNLSAENACLFQQRGAIITEEDLFFFYIENNMLPELEELLGKSKVDLEQKNNTEGHTGLILAARNGFEKIAIFLIDCGASVNTVAAYGEGVTALIMAAIGGFYSIVIMLLDKKANTEIRTDNGFTALMWACYYGRYKIVELLIDRGADFDGRSHIGYTPLMLVCYRGYDDIASLLLGLGAAVEQEADNGHTELTLASSHGHINIMNILLDVAKVDINQCSEDDGTTALMLAAQHGRETAVSHLIKRGALIQATDDYVAATLISAVYGEDVDTINILLSEGKIDANISIEQNGMTALIIAAGKGLSDIAAQLIDHNADVNQQEKTSGTTALLEAAEENHYACVVLLLSKGAEIDQCNSEGITPLMMAAQNGHSKITELLLGEKAELLSGKKADADICSPDGVTALFLASQNGHDAIVAQLLEVVTNINMLATEIKSTALMRAAKGGHFKTVKLLVRAGAEVNIEDINGCTALNFAAENGDVECIKFLLSKGASKENNNVLFTPLNRAIMRGRIDAVKCLIDDTNILERDPLYYVTLFASSLISGKKEIINFLEERIFSKLDPGYFKHLSEAISKEMHTEKNCRLLRLEGMFERKVSSLLFSYEMAIKATAAALNVVAVSSNQLALGRSPSSCKV